MKWFNLIKNIKGFMTVSSNETPLEEARRLRDIIYEHPVSDEQWAKTGNSWATNLPYLREQSIKVLNGQAKKHTHYIREIKTIEVPRDSSVVKERESLKNEIAPKVIKEIAPKIIELPRNGKIERF